MSISHTFILAFADRILRCAGLRACLMVAITLSLFAIGSLHFSGSAQAETRSLKLYFLHTGERATITYKRNGKFLPGGLKKLNLFLRDWRRNEPTKMDPNLFDLIWEVYRESGSRKAIHVISAYRSSATNNMLRKRGRGVAKKSQHTLGKAMDFFLPDVKLAKLRRIGLIKQVGGVGYYPRSGSPFVHMDTGRVRHWPRMTRKELVRIFPRGKTLHVPTDGKPLPGYNQAVAAYNARSSKSKKIVIAKGNEQEKLSFFQRLARVGREDRDEETQVAATAPKRVKTVTTKAAPPADVPQNPEPSPKPTAPSLPKIASIPVPRRAPRDSDPLAQGTQLAALDPAVADNIDKFEGAQTQQLASNIPIPTLRPQIEPTLVAKADEPANDQPLIAAVDESQGLPNIATTLGLDDETTLKPINVALASEPVADPAQISTTSTRVNGLNVANETASELRRKLLAQAGAQLNSATKKPPRPSQAVGSEFTTALLEEKANTTRPTDPFASLSTANTEADKNTAVERNSLKPIDGATPTTLTTPIPQPKPVLQAALEPIDKNLITGTGIPVPVHSPRTVEETQVASIEPIDSELKNDGSIPVPAQNPAEVAIAALADDNTATIIPLRRPDLDTDKQSIEVALVDPDDGNVRNSKTGIDGLIERDAALLANGSAIIPTPAPRTNVATLQAEPTDLSNEEIVLAKLDENPAPSAYEALKRAPRALDRFSMNWYERQTTGRYVLSTDTTVRKVSKLRAPAYGQASIRQAPDVVLTAGFTQSGDQNRADMFTGNAVSFQPFAKFN